MSGISTFFPAQLRLEVFQSTNWTCFYCRLPVVEVSRGHKRQVATVDHKIPKSRGGLDNKENLVPACDFCNSQKGTRTVEEYRLYLISIGVAPRFQGESGRVRDWLFVSKLRVVEPMYHGHPDHPHRRPAVRA